MKIRNSSLKIIRAIRKTVCRYCQVIKWFAHVIENSCINDFNTVIALSLSRFAAIEAIVIAYLLETIALIEERKKNRLTRQEYKNVKMKETGGQESENCDYANASFTHILWTRYRKIFEFKSELRFLRMETRNSHLLATRHSRAWIKIDSFIQNVPLLPNAFCIVDKAD